MHWPVLWRWDKRLIVIDKITDDLICTQNWDGLLVAADHKAYIRQNMPNQETPYRLDRDTHSYHTRRWCWGDYPIPYEDWKEMCKRAEETAGD